MRDWPVVARNRDHSCLSVQVPRHNTGPVQSSKQQLIRGACSRCGYRFPRMSQKRVYCTGGPRRKAHVVAALLMTSSLKGLAPQPFADLSDLPVPVCRRPSTSILLTALLCSLCYLRLVLEPQVLVNR